MAVFGVYLAWLSFRGRQALPSWKEVVALSTLGLITQLGGVLLVWAIGVIGVGVTMTLQMGLMLAASAILGRIVLGERVSRQQMAALVLITLSVAFISMGAQATGEPDLPSSPAASTMADHAAAERILLGVAAAILSGLAFAVLTVGVRKTVTGETLPEAVVFLINAMGVVALGPWCIHRLGLTTLLHTDPWCFSVMLGAGLFNLLGFLFLTKSLQWISVVRVNVVNNALTMVLTVAAGILLFTEPLNVNLAIGIALSMAGILLISIAAPQEEYDNG
jgi:drug/metabolite transporter (DMT)-like permease